MLKQLEGMESFEKVRKYSRQLTVLSFTAILLLSLSSCGREAEERKGAELYQTHCARCHIAPEMDALPKYLWSEKVLPEMAARMGIKEGDFDPMKGLSFEEMEILLKSGVFPYTPVIAEGDWKILKEYILSNAPDSLSGTSQTITYDIQKQFSVSPLSTDEIPGSYYTFLDYEAKGNRIWAGDVSGNLIEHDINTGETRVINKVQNAVVDYTWKDSVAYITDVGILDPSELSSGKIARVYAEGQDFIPETFHRPVNTVVADLDGDGIDELVVSEFGHRTGALTLMRGLPSGKYERKILLTQPGTIRAVVEDMDQDGKLDIVAITSQGDESITILYQRENLRFSVDKSIRFSPIYGSSWFEILDYDGDGDLDIVTVNGDNADKTYIAKPYHGLRIHLNDGQNNFKEEHFHPLNGATRFVSHDFDQDGDFDFAVISTFPDYEKAPELALVYLENKDAKKFQFEGHRFEEANLSRWFLLDKGDVDRDGDMDIILSAFTYVFTPVPDEFTKMWQANNVDMAILKNRLSETKELEATRQ